MGNIMGTSKVSLESWDIIRIYSNSRKKKARSRNRTKVTENMILFRSFQSFRAFSMSNQSEYELMLGMKAGQCSQKLLYQITLNFF
jgi:hypothetical protein